MTTLTTLPKIIEIPDEDMAFWDDADLISTYTRAQAIEDGVLVDVSTLASEKGFRVPVAVTATVEAKLRDFQPKSGQDYTGRLWDLLTMAAFAAKRAAAIKTDRVSFIVYFAPTGDETLQMVAGPGDNYEMVITIQYPDED